MGIKQLRGCYRLMKMYWVDSPLNNNPSIRLHNYVTNPVDHDFWIPRFIERNQLNRGKKVSVFSVFGLRSMIKLDRSSVKIFIFCFRSGSVIAKLLPIKLFEFIFGIVETNLIPKTPID